jgi:metal-responsive CopG/Arc/MetJ family transcriptional regulator
MNFKRNEELLERMAEIIKTLQCPERSLLIKLYNEMLEEYENEKLIQSTFITINDIDNEIVELDMMSDIIKKRRDYLKNELERLFESIN